MVSDPLHLLDICATSDGAAAVRAHQHRVRPPARARRRGADPGRSRRSRRPSRTPCSTCRTCRPTPRSAVAGARADLQGVDRARGVRGGRASAPRTSSLAEVYDLSTALELDWIEDLGLCKRGEAEALLRAGDTDDRRPDPGQPVRRAGLLRRGGAGAGAGPGVRGDLAAARPGGGPPGRGRPGRHHRQPGPLRPRLVGGPQLADPQLTARPEQRRPAGRSRARRRRPAGAARTACGRAAAAPSAPGCGRSPARPTASSTSSGRPVAAGDVPAVGQRLDRPQLGDRGDGHRPEPGRERPVGVALANAP